MPILCIYCGKRKGTTSDHAPPECLFPKPRPNNLITVPCCPKCNGEYSKIDERIRNLLTSLASTEEHSAISGQIANKRDRSFLRTKGRTNFRHILESIMMADVYSPGGIYLGSAPAFNLDQEVMDRFMEKMTRALLHETYSLGYIEGEVEWKLALPEKVFASIPSEIKAFQTSDKPKSIGDGIFTYFGYYKPGRPVSLWIMSFYTGVRFMSLFRAKILER